MRPAAVCLAVVLIIAALVAAQAPPARPLEILYPLSGSLFPPEVSAPTFLYRDRSAATAWSLEVRFADGTAPLRAVLKGAPAALGPVDPDCVSPTNEPPRLSPEFEGARSWQPDPEGWALIKRHSVAAPATVLLRGFTDATLSSELARAEIRLRTSRDPVGAPVFYRDVPLMPTETKEGVIQPLAAGAVRLVRWRLRDLSQPASRVVLENLPVCANCHSFSRDGRQLGMDLDGLQNNKGMYFIAPVEPKLRVGDENLIQWATSAGRLKGRLRIGFMSQMAPAGDAVLTTINPLGLDDPPDAPEPPSNYYVRNYRDYRYLQVFFPLRGSLAWWSRSSGVLRPLPGADDPRFVQMGGVWSPDGESIVFARAAAAEPNPPGLPPALFANDPNERQVRYDLYRIPFRNGQGGTAEPVAGASANGGSNTFPKLSPDGRWLVYVQARNGQLMRPDSTLWIVPAAGGTARRLKSNTARMNSWHSFSPNGRWLVFSSKARSPYTQMYLTHIDENGDDSPAIVVENSTASNRAVNLPEFINMAPGSLRSISGPALDYYRLYDRALYYQKQKRYAESSAAWQQVLDLRPGDPLANENRALVLLLLGQPAESARHRSRAVTVRLRQALALNPTSAGHAALGRALLAQQLLPEAETELRAAIAADENSLAGHAGLAELLSVTGRPAEAVAQWRFALRLQPDSHEALRNLAWLLATTPDPALRDADGALRLAQRAARLAGPHDIQALDTLAAAQARVGDFADAIETAGRALQQALGRPALSQSIAARRALYESRQPYTAPN